MRTRDVVTGIDDLVALLPPKMKTVVERACLENLRRYPKPERSTIRLNDHPHSYGPNSVKICDGVHKLLVFGEMLSDGRCSAPTFTGSKVETGKIDTLFPFDDMIVRFVDEEELAVYNITLPKHIFFPGYVKLAVGDVLGATVVNVSGRGRGNWMLPNTFGGPPLFKLILKEHLVPKVNRRLGRHTSHARTHFQGSEIFGWW